MFLFTAFSVSASSAANWYVNDFDTAGDVYTSASGSDTAGSGSDTSPFRTIAKAMTVVAAGDTVRVDAGIYQEQVTIAVDSLSLIGADSVSTIIDFNDSTWLTYARGVYADTQTGLLVKDLQISNCHMGVEWNNVDRSRIENVRARYNGSVGIYLYANADSNTLVGNTCANNNQGVLLDIMSNNNTLTNNTALNNSVYGFYFSSSNNDTMTNNTSMNSNSGFYLNSSGNNTLTGNTSTGNNNYGFSLSSSSNNTITDNASVFNNHYGFQLSASNNNTVTNNISANNKSEGFWLIASSNNRITNNTSSNNLTADGHNYQLASSGNNYFAQNTSDSSEVYEFYISNAVSCDTVVKNNIRTSPHSPTLGVWSNVTDSTFDFTRNWWETTDSQAIRDRIAGAGADSIIFVPFRLGAVDTAPGADTIAPAAPVAVSITETSGVDNSCTIVWSAATTNEEVGGALTDLGGYRVYRSTSSGTANWGSPFAATAPGDTDFLDSGLVNGITYYYRVTAQDNHAPWENESWYSDSVVDCVFTNVPPVAVTGADTEAPDTATILLDGSASYDSNAGTTLTYLWTADDDSVAIANPTDSVTTATFTKAGNFTITLQVNDGTDTGAPDTFSVNVYSTTLPGDFTAANNSGGKVDVFDLRKLIAEVALNWLAAPTITPATDMNSDGILDFEDIALFAVQYGKTQ